MKGLLVDDDELYARTLQRSLARKGIETEIALDAASALARAREYLPDFALVDLKLGSDSGLTLIEPLRALRMIHYAGWLARRWTDPAFPLAFPWFGTTQYWQDHVASLEVQLAALDEPALPLL